MKNKTVIVALLAITWFAARAADATEIRRTSFKLDFGSGKVAPGYMQVLPTTVYTKELGYGFEPGATVSAVDRGSHDALRSDFCTSDKPFFFSVALPEGNYKVSVTPRFEPNEATAVLKMSRASFE